MSEQKAVVVRHEGTGGTVRSYTAGFVLSLILTLTAYTLVVQEAFSGWALVGVLAALAVAQLLVQLYCFLHLGKESRPRWNLTVALFAAMVVFIVVFGSLWIMKNIQYNHHHGVELTPSQTNEFIIHDEGYNQ
jgi:cytochrome o ubiquinol oxidase operon protein cyoD